MYVPDSYKNENLTEVRRFIENNAFAILVSHADPKTLATHIPLELSKSDAGKDILHGHVAKANPHWKHFKDNTEVLAIFNGPHSYISSSWYDFEEVPTWNYIAVHVYGTVKIMEEKALYNSLRRLVDKYEAASENPVRVETLSKSTMRQIRGIVGFEIEITDIQPAYKLSQGHNDKNHEHIIEQLQKRSGPNNKEIAKAMKEERYN
jgi:transcriptional regulator